MYTYRKHGRDICVSFPLHEEHLIDAADKLAHEKCMTRSELFRHYIRQDKQSKPTAIPVS